MSLYGNTRVGPTVGIDIGSNQIKVAEARPGRDGAQITALGVAPTPPGTVENDTIVNPELLGQAIKDLLRESRISTNKSVSSVSGQSSVVVRIIEMPKMTEEELDKTMQWEVERHVPFAANEVVMDFQAINRPVPVTDEQNMEVLLAVAQQDVINNHVKTLFAAGLEPIAIEVEQVAISRTLLDTPKDENNDSAVIINIGSEDTEIGIYQHGLLAFPRTIPIAGNTLTRALSDSFNITTEEAEQLKMDKAVIIPERVSLISNSTLIPGINGFQNDDTIGGFDIPAADDDIGFIPGLGFTDSPIQMPEDQPADNADPDFDIDLGGAQTTSIPLDFDLDISDNQAAANTVELEDSGINEASSKIEEITETNIFDAIAPSIMDLISEIRRSLDYYSGKFSSLPDTAIICGGTAKIKGLDQLMQNELGIPVKAAEPIKSVTISSNALSSGDVEEVAAIFPLSLGLAVRDIIGE